MAHAKLSPSGSKKWIACAGSIAMESREPDSTSEYSDEGTAAHHIAALCLRDRSDPVRYMGTTVTVINGVVANLGDPMPPPLRGHTEDIVRSFIVNEEMVGAIRQYQQAVLSEAALGDLHVEQALPIEHITGEEGATGTGDAIIVIPDNPICDAEIQVHDFKYGIGVKVDACENTQLMMYASGAIVKYGPEALDGLTVTMFVHQPRIGHCDRWSIPFVQFAAHIIDIRERAVRAREMAHNFEADATALLHLVPGPHCGEGFCRARGTCPALAGYVGEVTACDFDDIRDVESMLPSDPIQVGRCFKAVDLIEDWCKQVRARAERYLFEHNNSPEVIQALGIKLVQGRRGPRHWRDPLEAEARMRKFRIRQAEMYERKLITPTRAEKLITQPARWKQLEALIEQRDGQPSVALLEDKRPALVLTPSLNEFENITGEQDDEQRKGSSTES